MKILNVSIDERRRFIPLKGWESVKSAIVTFEQGVRGSRDTEQVTIDAISDRSGPMAVGLFLLASVKTEGSSRLVEKLLVEGEKVLAKQDEYSKHYDYDGMGTAFFKTGVDIKVLDRPQDMYGIGIWAAYVGDKPEKGLAEHFGIPRALLSCSVEVEVEPSAENSFQFDFEPIAHKLEAMFETKMTGKQIAEAMMKQNKYDESKPGFILQRADGLEVSIKPGRVESRFVYRQAKRDTWSINGSLFSGELQEDFKSEKRGAKATPTFLVTLSSSDEDKQGYSRPIWNPEEQKKATDLAGKIAAVLRS